MVPTRKRRAEYGCLGLPYTRGSAGLHHEKDRAQPVYLYQPTIRPQSVILPVVDNCGDTAGRSATGLITCRRILPNPYKIEFKASKVVVGSR